MKVVSVTATTQSYGSFASAYDGLGGFDSLQGPSIMISEYFNIEASGASLVLQRIQEELYRLRNERLLSGGVELIVPTPIDLIVKVIRGTIISIGSNHYKVLLANSFAVDIDDIDDTDCMYLTVCVAD